MSKVLSHLIASLGVLLYILAVIGTLVVGTIYLATWDIYLTMTILGGLFCLWSIAFKLSEGNKRRREEYKKRLNWWKTSDIIGSSEPSMDDEWISKQQFIKFMEAYQK